MNSELEATTGNEENGLKLVSGTRGREFESHRPDHLFNPVNTGENEDSARSVQPWPAQRLSILAPPEYDLRHHDHTFPEDHERLFPTFLSCTRTGRPCCYRPGTECAARRIRARGVKRGRS